MVRLAGANDNAPPSPTMTVCVRVWSVVVVAAPGVVVVVVAPTQPPALQLSQQLGTVPTHAEPPMGAMHFASLDFTEHFVAPAAVVRQHVTKPVAPQVDFLAHFTTSVRHSFGRLPLVAAAFATCATQWTYGLWPRAVPHGHCSPAAARVDATAAGSVHAARAVPIESSSVTTILMKCFMTSSWLRRLRRGDVLRRARFGG